MSYKELQSALKNYRNSGVVLQVKLNATKAALQAEYNRITGNKQAPEVDEMQALRDKLAEARKIIEQQAATIKDLEDTIEQMQQEPEPEQTAEQETQEKREAENTEETEERKQATYMNVEVITTVRRLVVAGDYKGAARYMKTMMPKFHPDTCKTHGNEYNKTQWLDFCNLYELVKQQDICF